MNPISRILRSRLPVSITLIASCITSIGIEAFFTMAADLLVSKVTINLSALLIFVGIGLFNLSDSARKCTLVITWIGWIFLFGILILEFVKPGYLPVVISGVPLQGWERYFMLTVMYSIAGSILIWVRRTLLSPEIVSEFTVAKTIKQ